MTGIAAAEKDGGIAASAETMVRLLATDPLNDQFAALAWLRKQKFRSSESYRRSRNLIRWHRGHAGCGTRSYYQPSIRRGEPKAGGRAGAAIVDDRFGLKCARADIFFQAETDYDLSPSKVLSAAMMDAGKPYN